MNYTVNGEPRTGEPLSITELVAGVVGSETGVAVAVNETVVPRSGWDRQVADGDVIDILTAVQGG